MSQSLQSDAPTLSVVRSLPAERRLHLLDGFALTDGTTPIHLPTNVQHLVAFLALHERAISRLRVASALWPETSEARAGASLRSALWRLRSAAPWLLVGGEDLAIAEDVDVDVRLARDAARRMIESGDAFRPQIEPFLADLLPGWYDDWVIMERERYRQTRLHALESISEILTARGAHGPAIDAALAAVAGEPLRESAQRVLIRAHLAEGNVGEAVRQYRSYRDLLQGELGVAPSPELERLIPIQGI